jgi:hypothetical protein
VIDLIAAAADAGKSGDVPWWALVVISAVTALGVVVGAVVAPIGEKITRRDKLKTYKRNIYRNFLDHAYWYRSEKLSDEKQQERAEKYLADWHRIRLIAGPQSAQADRVATRP